MTIFRVYIYNSIGGGLLGLNVMGNSVISQSSFITNNPDCIFKFTDTASSTAVLQKVTFSIQHSNFLLGKNRLYFFAAGLSIRIQASYNISVNITNVTVRSNHFSNIRFEVNKCGKSQHIKIQIHAISCSHSQTTCLELEIYSLYCRKQVVMSIIQGYFDQNTEAVHLSSFEDSNGVAILENITFYKNSFISGMYVETNNVNFIQNIEETKAPIEIDNCNVVVHGNSIFIENRGNLAAVLIRKSDVKFQGKY